MVDKPSNFDIIAELVRETSGQGNIISLPRIYLKIAGDVVVGLFLSQCVWYSDKGGSGDGWFFKSNKEWQEEIGLSYAQIKRATAKLEEMGILHTKLKKAKGAPTTHYYVDMDRLTKLIFDFLEIRQNGGVENRESSKSKDFQESEKSLTALTPASTETTLTEGAAEKMPPATPPRDFLGDVFNGNVNMREGERLIRYAGWDIHSPEHRQALAAFLEASRLKIPPGKPSRKDWLKSIDTHVQAYGASQLEELYPRVIARMTDEQLSISRPGSVTNPLAALVGEMEREKNGDKHGANKRNSSRSGLQGSRKRAKYKVADPSQFAPPGESA